MITQQTCQLEDSLDIKEAVRLVCFGNSLYLPRYSDQGLHQDLGSFIFAMGGGDFTAKYVYCLLYTVYTFQFCIKFI